MHVTIDLHKRDLLAVSLQMLPRHRGNLQFVLLLASGLTLYQLWGWPLTGWALLIALATGVLAAVAGLLAGFLLQVLNILWLSARQPGLLGVHDYELRADGLFERTEVNEGLSRWAAVARVYRLRGQLVLLMQSGGAHILPRRSFASEEAFRAFCQQAERLRAAASDGHAFASARSWLAPLSLAATCLLLLMLLRSSPEPLPVALDSPAAASFDSAELLRGLQIEQFHEQRNGSQQRVLGSLLNSSPRTATYIELEVEMFDAAGQFVYECSQSISRKLAPGERENFQISCGCGDNGAPEHASLTVRVVSAGDYD